MFEARNITTTVKENISEDEEPMALVLSITHLAYG